MSAGGKVSKLERLLDTIRRNASRPRAEAVAVAAAAAGPAPVPAPQAIAAIDEAVDDLLDEGVAPASEDATARPALDTMSNLDVLDEEEFVEIAVDDGPPTPARVSPAAAAASPPADQSTDIDFDDDDEDEDERDVPASSRRPKATPETLDAALSSAADHADDEGREVPIKTPPPESGRQISGPAPPHLPEAAVPRDLGLGRGGELELDDLAADQGIAASAPLSGDRPVPSMAQLGDTIELEGAESPAADFELAPVSERPPPVTDELEASIPMPGAGGRFTEALAPPPEAREDLRRLRSDRPPPPAPVPSPPAPVVAVTAPAPAPPAPAAAAVKTPLLPDVTQRPPAGPVEAATFQHGTPVFEPKTFLELLDASLGLGR